MDSFLAAPETGRILGKYFVLAKLNVEEKAGKHPELESPGGEDLALKLGGSNAKGRVIGVPFFLFLDANGEPIVDSKRPVDGRPGGISEFSRRSPLEARGVKPLTNCGMACLRTAGLVRSTEIIPVVGEIDVGAFEHA